MYDIDATLAALITDVQQARLHGFADQELEMAKRATLAAAEHMAQTESTRDALVFIRAMNRTLSLGEHPLSAAQQVPARRGQLATASQARSSRRPRRRSCRLRSLKPFWR